MPATSQSRAPHGKDGAKTRGRQRTSRVIGGHTGREERGGAAGAPIEGAATRSRATDGGSTGPSTRSGARVSITAVVAVDHRRTRPARAERTAWGTRAGPSRATCPAPQSRPSGVSPAVPKQEAKASGPGSWFWRTPCLLGLLASTRSCAGTGRSTRGQGTPRTFT